MKWFFIFLTAVVVTGCRENEDDILRSLFFERSVEGGILISSLTDKTEYFYNKERIETPFTPDSTFYIFESIVALDEKIASKDKPTIAWDGEDRGLAEWNRDQSLETAYKFSCLWANQQIVNQMGLPRLSSSLKRTKYGNTKIGPSLSKFWTNGTLLINGRQQIEFLRNLYLETLPFSRLSQKTIKSWMVTKTTKNETLYAKTAWASHSAEQHGWNVGFVETRNRGTWLFSLNMRIEQASEAPFRQEIVEEALRKKGIIN